MHSPLSTPLFRLLAIMVIGAVIAIGGNTLGHLLGIAVVLCAAVPFAWLAMRHVPRDAVPSAETPAVESANHRLAPRRLMRRSAKTSHHV